MTYDVKSKHFLHTFINQVILLNEKLAVEIRAKKQNR